MFPFKAGDKIVCIDNKGSEELTEKEMYTVAAIGRCEVTKKLGVVLVEMDPEAGFFFWRFRKLDHKFAEDILDRLKRERSEEIMEQCKKNAAYFWHHYLKK